jgi:hypothetical protein
LASAVALLIWLRAGAVTFLPFASDTSRWDTLTLRVPGNQGNWWHFLAAAPFFLALLAIWLHLPFSSTCSPLEVAISIGPVAKRVGRIGKSTQTVNSPVLPFPTFSFSQTDIGCTATLNPSPCAGFSEDFRFNT